MFYWFVKGIFFPFVSLYLGLTAEGWNTCRAAARRS